MSHDHQPPHGSSEPATQPVPSDPDYEEYSIDDPAEPEINDTAPPPHDPGGSPYTPVLDKHDW